MRVTFNTLTRLIHYWCSSKQGSRAQTIVESIWVLKDLWISGYENWFLIVMLIAPPPNDFITWLPASGILGLPKSCLIRRFICKALGYLTGQSNQSFEMITQEGCSPKHLQCVIGSSERCLVKLLSIWMYMKARIRVTQ